MSKLRVGACVLAASVWLAAGFSYAGDRTERRAGEMALPDPYLDPSWPDEAGEEMNGRYAPGDSDSVEEVPLDDGLEIEEERRALQALTGEPPPAGQPAPATGPAAAAPTADNQDLPAGPVDEAPATPQPYVPSDEDDSPGAEDRDPVEW